VSFDGTDVHDGWGVLVRWTAHRRGRTGRDAAQGSARRIALPGMTLLPGLIEGQFAPAAASVRRAAWSDQVLHEPARAGASPVRPSHARETLRAGFHHRARPRHRGRGLRRRGAQARHRPGIIPVREWWSSRAPSWPRGATRRGSPRRSTCCRAPRRRTTRHSSAWCAIRSAAAPTGSRSTPTSARARRRAPPDVHAR
jgi:hypothetical protein